MLRTLGWTFAQHFAGFVEIVKIILPQKKFIQGSIVQKDGLDFSTIVIDCSACEVDDITHIRGMIEFWNVQKSVQMGLSVVPALMGSTVRLRNCDCGKQNQGNPESPMLT